MSKWQIDAMLDAALSVIKDQATSISLCNAQPADRNEAIGSSNLAMSAVDPGFFTIGDATDGRRAVVSQVADITVSATGIATHVAVCSDTELLYVTMCVSQEVSVGNLVTIPTWEIEMRDAR